MGVSIDTGGKGGKRPLDAELNLVPFIDLLVCCICFLLITAVWTSMARISVNQQGPSRALSDAPPPDVPPVPKLRVAVLIGDEGHTITAGVQRLVVDRNKGADYDYEALGERMKDLQTEITASGQERDILRLLVEDGIAYRDIVRTMDILVETGFAEMRLSDSSAQL